MAKLLNARLLVIATIIFLLISFVGIRALMAEGKTKVVESEKVSRRAVAWFEYTGPGTSDPQYETEALNPMNYQPISGNPSCTTGEQLCAVQVETDSSDPDHPDQDALNANSDQILQQSPQDPNIVRFRN